MSILKTRQPKGIPVGGQFAATAHGEASVSLGATPGSALVEQSILAMAARHTGPGVLTELERQLAAVTTPEGRELLLQTMDSAYNPESPYLVDRYSGSRPKPADCDALAALGYTDMNQVARENTKNFSGIDSIIRHEIEPERLEVLGKLSTHEFQWSGWERQAYLHTSVERLDDVVADNDLSRVDKYLATVDLLDLPFNSHRARTAIELKIGDKGLIEADKHPLPDLAELRDALPESKRSVSTIVGLADKGITAGHLKKYGANACDQFTAKDLDASGLEAKTIRSFLISGVRPDLAQMKALHTAGFTSGADIKAASQAMGTNDTKALSAARKHATGEQLARFSTATRGALRSDDPKAIGRLNKLGITDPGQLRPYSSAIHPKANAFLDRDQSILAIHADVIKAGITPERLAKMTRAGVPVTEAAQHATTADLWAAGKPVRDAWDTEQAWKVEKRWQNTAIPWEFTEDNFADEVAGE